MSFLSYYPVVPISYVESPAIIEDNQPVGYKWYQSHPSSDMDVMAASSCSCGCQSPIPETQVGAPKLFSHEYEPPPTDLSISYASKLPAYKMFDKCPERIFSSNGEIPITTPLPVNSTSQFTLTYNTTLSTGQFYYGVETTSVEECPKMVGLIFTPGGDSVADDIHQVKLAVPGVAIVGDEGKLQVDVLKPGGAVVGTVEGNSQADGSRLVKKAIEVQRELIVDEVEVVPQVFDKSPVSSDALDIPPKGTNKFIQTTDRILLQMEELKHLLLAMSPPSKRGEVITTHKAVPTPVDKDLLVIQATEIEVAPLGENFESEESLFKKEVNASNLQGAVNGSADIWEGVFATGRSLQKLAEIGNTKMIENFVMKTDERLLEESLFAKSYGVAISGVIDIASVGSKESRDESGKEGGIADEGVLVPTEDAETSFTVQCEMEELMACLRNSELTVWESRLILHYCAKVGDELRPSGKPPWVPLNVIGVEDVNKKENLKNVRDYIADVSYNGESMYSYGVVLTSERSINFIPEVQQLIIQLNEVLALRIVNEGRHWQYRRMLHSLALEEILHAPITYGLNTDYGNIADEETLLIFDPGGHELKEQHSCVINLFKVMFRNKALKLDEAVGIKEFIGRAQLMGLELLIKYISTVALLWLSNIWVSNCIASSNGPAVKYILEHEETTFCHSTGMSVPQSVALFFSAPPLSHLAAGFALKWSICLAKHLLENGSFEDSKRWCTVLPYVRKFMGSLLKFSDPVLGLSSSTFLGNSLHKQTEAVQQLRRTELAANTNITEQKSEPPKHYNEMKWLVSPNFSLKGVAEWKVADEPLNYVQYHQQPVWSNDSQLCYVLTLPNQLKEDVNATKIFSSAVHP